MTPSEWLPCKASSTATQPPKVPSLFVFPGVAADAVQFLFTYRKCLTTDLVVSVSVSYSLPFVARERGTRRGVRVSCHVLVLDSGLILAILD